MTHELIDQLLGQTGLHIGTTRDTREDAAPQAARSMVRPLPGRSGLQAAGRDAVGRAGGRSVVRQGKPPSN